MNYELPKHAFTRGKKWYRIRLTKQGALKAAQIGPGRWNRYVPPNEAKTRRIYRTLVRAEMTSEKLARKAETKAAQAQSMYEKEQHEFGLKSDDDACELMYFSDLLKQAGR